MPSLQNKEGKQPSLLGSYTKAGKVKALISHYSPMKKTQHQHGQVFAFYTSVAMWPWQSEIAKNPDKNNDRIMGLLFGFGFWDDWWWYKKSYLYILCLYNIHILKIRTVPTA